MLRQNLPGHSPFLNREPSKRLAAKAANSAAKKAGEETVKVVKKIPNKALAVIVAGIALAANIWTASLNATEKSSNIDHRWTGHKQ